jgi:hypothetical protein
LSERLLRSQVFSAQKDNCVLAIRRYPFASTEQNAVRKVARRQPSEKMPGNGFQQ